MSKIAVFAKSKLDAKSLHLIHIITQISIEEIRNSQIRGLPIVQYVLFENDYRDVAKILISLAKDLELMLDFCESEDNLFVENQSTIARHRIGKDVLLNILSGAESYGQ